MNWIRWAPLAAASLHIVEEFFWPGGFPEWDRAYRPAFASTITPRFHIIINGLLLILCYDAGQLVPTPSGVALWLAVTALLAGNAIWHLVGAYKTRRYSPGMVTGLLLYLPLMVWGYVWFLRTGLASYVTAILAFLVGASYTLFVGKALHRMRKRRTS